MRVEFLIVLAVLGSSSVAVRANDEAAVSDLAGVYLGAAATAVNHHFILEETSGGVATSRNVTRWGAGGAAIAGINFTPAGKMVLGIQGQLDFGGAAASTETAFGRVAIDPRWGYSATARVGYAFSRSSWAYVGGGFGGHRYRTTFPADVEGLPDWNRSFVLTGGAELPVGKDLRARMEFQHLDGTRNAFIVGLVVKL